MKTLKFILLSSLLLISCNSSYSMPDRSVAECRSIYNPNKIEEVQKYANYMSGLYRYYSGDYVVSLWFNFDSCFMLLIHRKDNKRFLPYEIEAIKNLYKDFKIEFESSKEGYSVSVNRKDYL